MNTVVLNGSPKGELSVTMQYVSYGIRMHPEHRYEIIDIAQKEKLNAILNDKNVFEAILSKIEASDLVIWAVPVYACMVPTQVKQFIEKVFCSKTTKSFSNKHTAVVSTSAHVYDQTAMRYLNAVCDDFGMRYLGFFSAEMFDLLIPNYRKQLESFFDSILTSTQKNVPVSRSYHRIKFNDFVYVPASENDMEKKVALHGKKLLVVTDSLEPSSNLESMVKYFVSCFEHKVEVVSLNDIGMKSGCDGVTLPCQIDHMCTHDDGFADFYINQLMKADILVYAGTIKDRFLSSEWKTYFDRAMFQGHVPSFPGKQIGWIISGPMRQIPNIRDTLEGYFEMQKSHLVDFVTDEYNDSKTIDSLLLQFAIQLVDCSKREYVPPPTFLGVGGHKLLYNLITYNRVVFQKDYDYYKKGKHYDLRSATWSTDLLARLLILLTKVPTARGYLENNFSKLLLLPFRMVPRNKEVIDLIRRHGHSRCGQIQ